MSFREIIRLAIEALTANKLRSGLTMLGLIIGVAAVVLLVSIGEGARKFITKEFEGMGTNLIMVQPGKTDKKQRIGPPMGGSKEKLTLQDVTAIERQARNIDAVTGVTMGSASIKYEGAVSNVSVLGSNAEFIRIFTLKLSEGEFFGNEADTQGRRVVVLGVDIAKNLFADTSGIGKLVKINGSEFRVIGVTAKAGNSLGFNFDEIAFIPTQASLKLFNEDKLLGLRAKAKSKASVEDAVNEVKEILKARHNGEEDFTVLTQDSMLETMNTILGMLTYMLGAIAMISMLVGGIGIMNIMLVSVTERTREIGIRRAVGARQKDVLRQFLAEALALSLVGGLIGLLGSVALTYLISFATGKFDMRAPYWILLPAFGISSATGILFGVWPARKAAKIETIEALRFE